MKAIKCCGDCGYYNWEKQNCSKGASDKGEVQGNFYADCPIVQRLFGAHDDEEE